VATPTLPQFKPLLESVMIPNRILLALIGARFPAIFDVIPRGPQSAALGDRLSAVALNPQPLPPLVLGAAVATEVIRLTFEAGRGGAGFDVPEDWCPTVPRRPKLPIWWPPIPEPEPHPEWFVEFHLGFAMRLSLAASAAGASPLAATLDKGVERSLAAIARALPAHASEG
jgi:hypothetical protein